LLDFSIFLTWAAAANIMQNQMVLESTGSVMADDQLSAAFAALADPTRRAILARLLTHEASVVELAKPFHMTTRAVSKHIGVLEAAGLVTRSRDAQRRPSRIRMEPLADIDAWLQTYRRLWKGRFDRLHKHLASQQKDIHR
jgi:DNA-binding transcriptional ArsR family regulator